MPKTNREKEILTRVEVAGFPNVVIRTNEVSAKKNKKKLFTFNPISLAFYLQCENCPVIQLVQLLPPPDYYFVHREAYNYQKYIENFYRGNLDKCHKII